MPNQKRWPPVPSRSADNESASPSAETIQGLGHRLRELFEAKNWPQLEQEAGVAEVWFYDAPMRVSTGLKLAAEHVADQVQVMLLRIQKSSATEDLASGTYTCVAMWVDTETWEQTEVEFDLHLGFSRASDGSWRLGYVGFTAATPLELFAEPEPTDVPPWPKHDPSSNRSSDLSVGSAGVGEPAAANETLVYVPVLVSADRARSLVEAAHDLLNAEETHTEASEELAG